MPNPEAMAKANEKRMTGLEKRLETFEKEFRKGGDFASLAKRISTLEVAVKALATTAKSAGAADQVVKGELKGLRERVKEREAEISQIERKGSVESAKKIDEINKRKDMLEKTIVALSGRTDREAKAREAEHKKIVDDHKALAKSVEEQNKKIIESARLENRLQVLEGKVNAALSK